MLHEQQRDSNRPTIIENFGENSLFNPYNYCKQFAKVRSVISFCFCLKKVIF